MRRYACAVAALLICVAGAGADIVHLVASSGQPGEMKAILAKNAAALSARDSLGRTPLMVSAGSGNVPVLRLLLEAGADIAAVDSLDRDALDCAIYAGAYDAARVLADRGTVIDRQYVNGQTRLTLAAARGDIAATHFLLLAGADMRKANKDGLMPLDAGRKSGYTAVVDILSGFKLPARPAVSPSGLSPADSARLYAVSTYENSDSLFAAIRSGRRSFAACTLKQLDLANANLAMLDFSGADLSGCDLRRAVLVGSPLRKANLRNAYLRKADLRKTDLKGAQTHDAYFTLADLRASTGLELDQLRKSRNVFGAKFEKDLDEQVKQYCKPQLVDPGNDWTGNPWFAESKVKQGDTTAALP